MLAKRGWECDVSRRIQHVEEPDSPVELGTLQPGHECRR